MTCCNRVSRETFRPNYKDKELTLKFYARHDNNLVSPHMMAKVPFYENEVEKKLLYEARDDYLAPRTENQMYGWLERKQFVYTDPLEYSIFKHPKSGDSTTRVMNLITAYQFKERKYGFLR